MKELLKYLKTEATAQSYSRGYSYYKSGAVENVEKCGVVFTAVVEGTDTYEAEIIIDEKDIESDCSCPYDFGGICKHIVAVGLAISNGEYSVFSKTVTQTPNKVQNVFSNISNQQTTPKQTAKPVDTTFKDISFERVFNHATTEQKNWFLKQILTKDTNWRTQFINFVQPPVAKVAPLPPSPIPAAPLADKPLSTTQITEQTSKEILNKLKTLSFNNLENVKKVQLEHAFEPYQTQINTYIAKADFVRAMAILMGLYEAFLAQAPYSTDEVMKGFFANKLPQIDKAIKGQLAIVTQKIIDFIFERAKTNPNYLKNPKNLADFAPFLIQITPNSDLARYLYQTLLALNADLTTYSPDLLFHIAELTQNTDLWYSSAKKLATYAPQIAQKLLVQYAKDNRKTDFYNLAQKLFDTDAQTHAEFLSQYVQLTDYPKLYKQIWLYLSEQAVYQNNFSVFDKLMPILLDTEIDDYLTKFAVQNPTKYTQMLVHLKRYDDVLEYAINQRKKVEFNQIILPILNIYPMDSFDILRQNVYNLLDTDQSRAACKKICEWLKLMHQIKGFDTQTKAFIAHIYEIKIPTLKNEMILAKLLG